MADKVIRGIDKHAKKKRVGVLMGGVSAEREISLKTGDAILSSLHARGWDAVGIDAGRDVCNRLTSEGTEVAFLALHGKFGEDGTIQGLLEIMGIPYTGSGVLASALAMHKACSRSLFQCSDIPTPLFMVVKERNGVPMEVPFGFPFVIKPCSQGSTIGTHIIKTGSDFAPAIDDAFRYDSEVIIEEFIPGREVTVGILGDEPLPIVEIVPKSGFYDFTAKYSSGETQYLCPAPLGDEVTRRVRDLGIRAHRALGCRDLSRVDFRVRGDGMPFCLEVNSIPGMTGTSLLPKAASVAGIGFGDLVERILIMALSRA